MKTLTALFIISFLPLGLLPAQDTCGTSSSSTTQQYLNATINLKILLVRFTDIGPKSWGEIMKYTRSDFEDLLGSLGTYVSPNKYSPDGDPLFGSMEDYFNKMSSGNVILNAYLLNNLDVEFSRPVWITLPYTKSYYYGFHFTTTPIISHALSAAQSAGLDITRSDNTKLVIIYAGNTYTDFSGLNPLAKVTDHVYIMSEVQGRPYGQENATDKFSRIGFHCHEFAHLLGLGHSAASRADLMSGAGVRNGSPEGNAPAPLNPAMRALKGWITPTTLATSQPRDIYYSLISPQVFRINSNYNNDYFIFENRRFDQNMTIGSTSVPDYNNLAFFPSAWPHSAITQGIFVWRVIGGNPYDETNNGLVYASGRIGMTYPENTPSETDDGVPFPGVSNTSVLSPWSDSRNPYGSGNIFVPNTKPGTNVGMEILGENSSSGFFTVYLYASNPQDASPSRPRNLRVTNTSYSPISLSWDANNEPDISSYEIWRRELIEPTQWQLIATTSSTAHTDYSYIWLPSGNADLEYKIRAKDTQNKLSTFSDVAFTEGEPVSKPIDELLVFEAPIPSGFDLQQNFPNPFNPETEISFALPEPSSVKISILSVLGREISTPIDADFPAGFHKINWRAIDTNGIRIASGVYFYRINVYSQSGKLFTNTRKMVLSK